MWLRSLFLDHIWLKLFSLLLATLLWLAVDANINREIGRREFDPGDITTNFFARPVLIVTDAGAHGPVKIEPPTVDIAIRAHPAVLSRIDPRDIRPFVRVPDRPDFDSNVAVLVQLPDEASLIMVSPSVVRIQPGPAEAAPPR